MLAQITASGTFNGLSATLLTGGAILAVIGAPRIYYKWSTGAHDIERDIMQWGGGVLLLTLGGLVVRMTFGY